MQVRVWSAMMRWLAPLLCAACSLGCEGRRSDPLQAASATEPSPNASILPAPLAGAPKLPVRDAGHSPLPEGSADARAQAPPSALGDDEILPPDTELRSAPGLGLEARFRWLEPALSRTPDDNVEALARARERTAFELAIELSVLGRMDVRFTSPVAAFPAGLQLRAREDRYGHLLLWPGGGSYTPLTRGTLRALLGEARLDVTQLADPSPSRLAQGVLLGLPTERQALETSLGRLELEQATLPAAGTGGVLLCRLLLELIAVSPESAACRVDAVPLRAEYVWPSGVRLGFEVVKLLKRVELPLAALATPPLNAERRRGELPSMPTAALLDDRALSDFRMRALPKLEKPELAAPKIGLAVHNRSDSPRYVLVDGVPVVWLKPGADWLVTGLKSGRYRLQSRDFSGADTTAPRSLELPARFLIGDEPERSLH